MYTCMLDTLEDSRNTWFHSLWVSSCCTCSDRMWDLLFIEQNRQENIIFRISDKCRCSIETENYSSGWYKGQSGHSSYLQSTIVCEVGGQGWHTQSVALYNCKDNWPVGINLPPTEDSFRQHVLRAKYQTWIWCESHITNQEVIEQVGHDWSACDSGGITQTMFPKAPSPVEVRDWLIFTAQIKIVWVRVSVLASWLDWNA